MKNIFRIVILLFLFSLGSVANADIYVYQKDNQELYQLSYIQILTLYCYKFRMLLDTIYVDLN